MQSHSVGAVPPHTDDGRPEPVHGAHVTEEWQSNAVARKLGHEVPMVLADETHPPVEHQSHKPAGCDTQSLQVVNDVQKSSVAEPSPPASLTCGVEQNWFTQIWP